MSVEFHHEKFYLKLLPDKKFHLESLSNKKRKQAQFIVWDCLRFMNCVYLYLLKMSFRRILRCFVLHFIHYFSDKTESPARLLMALPCQPTQAAIRQAMMIHLSYHIIETHRIDKSDEEYHQELSRRSKSQQEREYPEEDVDGIDEYHGDGSADMRKTYLNKQMMEMALVGMER